MVAEVDNLIRSCVKLTKRNKNEAKKSSAFLQRVEPLFVLPEWTKNADIFFTIIKYFLAKFGMEKCEEKSYPVLRWFEEKSYPDLRWLRDESGMGENCVKSVRSTIL